MRKQDAARPELLAQAAVKAFNIERAWITAESFRVTRITKAWTGRLG
jgi:hypothetical protein